MLDAFPQFVIPANASFVANAAQFTPRTVETQEERERLMFRIRARIPPELVHLGSLEFAKKLLAEARVAVSPGIGFGEYGDAYVRFALIENAQRTRQALRGIKEMMRNVG